VGTSHVKKLLFGVAFFLSFACAADGYPDSAKSTRTTVTVNIVWLSAAQVNSVCAFLVNQPLPSNGVFLGCYNPDTATIYAVEPTSFNDRFHLETLGHEFWHALGAEHPPR
jgi:hypothetical protein